MLVGISANACDIRVRVVANNMQENFVYMKEDWLFLRWYLSRVARANGWTYIYYCS
jgi:hypothetical protein